MLARKLPNTTSSWLQCVNSMHQPLLDCEVRLDVHKVTETKDWLEGLSPACVKTIVDMAKLQAEDMLAKHRMQSAELMDLENSPDIRTRFGGTLSRNDPNESVLGIVDREVTSFTTQRMVVTSARMCARWNKTPQWLLFRIGDDYQGFVGDVHAARAKRAEREANDKEVRVRVNQARVKSLEDMVVWESKQAGERAIKRASAEMVQLVMEDEEIERLEVKALRDQLRSWRDRFYDWGKAFKVREHLSQMNANTKLHYSHRCMMTPWGSQPDFGLYTSVKFTARDKANVASPAEQDSTKEKMVEALKLMCKYAITAGLVRTGAAGAAAATGAAALGSAAAAGGTTTAGSGAAAQDEDEVAEAGADTFDDGDEDGAPVTKRGDEDARCPNSVASTYDDLEAVVEATAPKTAGAAAAVADRAEELRYSAPAEAAAEEEEEEVVAAVPSVPALPEGAALEQKRVEVWWGADARWYAGTITRFTRTTGVHHIYYDDGQRAQLDLSDLQQTPCRLVYK
jgi:hypothetical protein